MRAKIYTEVARLKIICLCVYVCVHVHMCAYACVYAEGTLFGLHVFCLIMLLFKCSIRKSFLRVMGILHTERFRQGQDENK